ncbi:MAG: UbiA family prenyltransferase [Halobacteria archaeon]|nr:UbiA family prenyltransferase [Halobacteria archaeon]
MDIDIDIDIDIDMDVLGRIKSYLQLTRFQTVPQETIPAVVGASLAAGGLFDARILLWAVFGLLYHATGYSHNSLEDWKRGWDTDDPNKQHHPLNAGKMTEREAQIFVYLMVLVTVGYTLAIIQTYLALYMIIAGAIAGVVYNTVGKRTKWKFLFISFAHSSTFAVPYLSIQGEITPVFFAGFAYVFFWVVFQISISGEVMGLTQDEEDNFLKGFGSSFEEAGEDYMVDISRFIRAYSFGVRLIVIGLALGFAYLVKQEVGALMELVGPFGVVELGILVVGAMSLVFTRNLLADGLYERMERVGNVAKIEISTQLMMLIAIAPVIGAVELVGVFVLTLVWVVTFNKIAWGTLLAPDV